MSILHKITLSWSGTTGIQRLSKTVTLTGDREVNLSQAIPENASTEYIVDWTNADLQSVYVLASIDCSLETNAHGGGAQDTFALLANEPFCWYQGCGFSNPFDGDVTSIFLTPDDPDTAGTVEVRVIED